MKFRTLAAVKLRAMLDKRPYYWVTREDGGHWVADLRPGEPWLYKVNPHPGQMAEVTSFEGYYVDVLVGALAFTDEGALNQIRCIIVQE